MTDNSDMAVQYGDECPNYAAGIECDCGTHPATYQDIMEMMDDRDDRDDRPLYGDESDFCPHGKYVGGSGIDWMCDWCESGISVEEMHSILNHRKLTKIRENAAHAEKALNLLLQAFNVDENGTHYIKGSVAQRIAQETSYVGNPLTRYGRH